MEPLQQQKAGTPYENRYNTSFDRGYEWNHGNNKRPVRLTKIDIIRVWTEGMNVTITTTKGQYTLQKQIQYEFGQRVYALQQQI